MQQAASTARRADTSRTARAHAKTDGGTRDGRKSGSLGFVVEGKFIADLARTRYEEGHWDRALRLLTEAFDGMSTDQAIAILKGEADLTGTSDDSKGINLRKLAADGPLARRMRAVTERLYGQVFRYSDAYWRPYARVTSWGVTDMTYAANARNPRRYVAGDGIRDWRSLYYADRPDDDLLVNVPHPSPQYSTDVLCKQVTAPPFWLEVSVNEPVAYLTKLLAQGLRLPERGYSADDRPVSVKGHARSRPDEAAASDEADAATDALDDTDQPAPTVHTGETASAAPTGDVEAAPKDERPWLEQAQALIEAYRARLAATTDANAVQEMSRATARALDAIAKQARTQAVWDLQDAFYRQAARHYERKLAAAVRAQADRLGGYFTLKLTDPKNPQLPFASQPELQVPLHPFLLWALGGFNFEDNGRVRPQWECVSPRGLKMPNDDPYHSDWMLGAGLPMDDAYDRSENAVVARAMAAAYERKFELVTEWTSAPFAVLARSPEDRLCYGTVVHPAPNATVPAGSIAVVPHAGPEYEAALRTASAPDKYGCRGLLICETGGKLAHLAVVAREQGATVLMLPDARKRLPPGARVNVDLDAGKLQRTL